MKLTLNMRHGADDRTEGCLRRGKKTFSGRGAVRCGGVLVAASIGLALTAVRPSFGGTPSSSQRIDPAAGRIVALQAWKTRGGDAAEWARPDGDDASWISAGWQDFRSVAPGIRWYRASLYLLSAPGKTMMPAVRFVNLPMAVEVYWDGERLGENGRVGRDRASEKPGRVVWTVKIPPAAAGPGLHVLALRTSNWGGRSRAAMFGISWGDAYALEAASRSSTDRQLLYAGVYLTACLFCLALYIGTGRHRSYLIFFFYTLIQFLSTAVSYAVDAAGLTFTAYYSLLPVELGWPFVQGLFLNLFFLYHFDLPRKIVHVLMMGAILAPLTWHGLNSMSGNISTTLAMSLYAAGLLFYALRRRKPGAAAALAGVGILAAVSIYTSIFILAPSETWVSPKFLFSVGQGGFLACVILAIALTIRAQSRRFEALRLRSQRLENELLKKSIQPHFIMNTLQSIKSWYARDAGRAERLIESLAEEFRIINRVSGEAEIPVEDEIRLCRHHLELMGLRRAARYDLQVEGMTEGVTIPPMILHTLIENGLTHAYEPREDGNFRLEVLRQAKRREFRLTNDGSRLARPKAETGESAREGMGLKYVKARLEESGPRRWSLESGMKDGLWEVRIIMDEK